MNTKIAIGIALIVVGGVLIFLGLRSSKSFTGQANGASITVGGNYSGQIKNLGTVTLSLSPEVERELSSFLAKVIVFFRNRVWRTMALANVAIYHQQME